jgi:hypothetical protein
MMGASSVANLIEYMIARMNSGEKSFHILF